MPEVIYGWEIEEAVKENNLHCYYPYKCSICGEPYGYYFTNGVVTFDGACGCGSIFGERLSNFQEIADIYNKNKDINFRVEFLEFFKIGV